MANKAPPLHAQLDSMYHTLQNSTKEHRFDVDHASDLLVEAARRIRELEQQLKVVPENWTVEEAFKEIRDQDEDIERLQKTVKRHEEHIAQLLNTIKMVRGTRNNFIEALDDSCVQVAELQVANKELLRALQGLHNACDKLMEDTDPNYPTDELLAMQKATEAILKYREEQ